jgi:hypothetical protein
MDGSHSLLIRSQQFGTQMPQGGQSTPSFDHLVAVALFAMYYNFVRIHKTLRTSPGNGCERDQALWEIGDIVNVLEAWEAGRIPILSMP